MLRFRAFHLVRENRPALALSAGLVAANVAAWCLVFAIWHGQPALLATALLAWVFGLRHAVDADHIAAIDNVVRGLMGRGARPVSLGLWFSLGHSTIVGLATAALVWSAPGVQARLSHWAAWGGDVGTLISAGFLFAIALANGVVLRDTWLAWRAPGLSTSGVAVGGGFLARLCGPLLQMIRRSWHIYPVGFLFGLGFDTATEIGLLGLSVTQASHGVAPWHIMLLPALFTAGMALVDSADCILMVGAYGWAFFDPARKLLYNLVMTAVSVGVALVIGGVETVGLLTDHGALRGGFWQGVGGLNGRFGSLGLAAIGVFAGCWVFSALILRYRRRDLPA